MSTKIEPRIWKHTILQGDDEETLRELRGAAERIKPAKPRPALADEWDAYDAAAKKADDFADEANPRGVTVTLRTIGRKRWAELIKEHPPREDDAADVRQGVNLDTFPEALVPVSITAPTFGDGELDEFLDAISPAEFETLALGAWNLHKGLGADPKERLLSAVDPS